MLRCALPGRQTVAALLLALCCIAAAAQGRTFPLTALRGELVVTQPPAAELNGKPARLAPGSRIRGENNLLQLSGGLLGRRMVVHYTLDLLGQVKDVWVLTDEERARRPWPTTPEEAQSWSFDAATQTWVKP